MATVQIPGEMVPQGSTDPLARVDYLKGVDREVADTTARDAIAARYLATGMRVRTLGDGSTWRYTGSAWADVTPALAADVAALTFSSIGGTATLSQLPAITIAKISATGTPNSSTFLRGDGSWQTISASATWDSVTGTLTNTLPYTGAIQGGDQTKGGTESKVVQVTSNTDGTALVALRYTFPVSSFVDFKASIVLKRTSGSPIASEAYRVDYTGSYTTDSSGAATAVVALVPSGASPVVSGVSVSVAINTSSTPHKIEFSVTVPNTQTWAITSEYGRTSAK